MAICSAKQVFLAILFLPFFSSFAYATRVTLSCGTVGQELEICKSGATAWAKATGNTVEILPSPSSAGERLSQLQLLLATKSSDIDVFLIDSTWPGILADFLVDLNSNASIRRDIPKFFGSFIKNNTIQNKLVALPWFIDAGLLYFRKDLLRLAGEEPPKTWPDLTRIAKKIQEQQRRKGNSRFWGFVFQGRAYEGLTCNGVEWLRSLDLEMMNPSNPKASEIFNLAASWIGSISPRGVLNFMEEESRGVFQSGNAAFMRNWPYAWKLANSADSPIKGKVEVTSLPGRAATLGGWSLAVSKYSKNQNEAIQLVRYLTSADEQKRRALKLGQNPTLLSLYQDPELLSDNPKFPLFLKIFENATLRPARSLGPRYPRISSEFWETLHEILSGKSKVKTALEAFNKKLLFLTRGTLYAKS